MTVAYIGVGSNIDPQNHIPMALERLQQQLKVIDVSPFYLYPAMGTALGQADFINGMISVSTSLSADQLKFKVLREIEFELGRNKEMSKFSARQMDLDLILYGDEIIEELNIPEKDILSRPYIYEPLLDISPKIIIPGYNTSLKALVDQGEGSRARKSEVSFWS